MISKKSNDIGNSKLAFWGSTGQKIRRIRERKGIIAPKLAEQCKTTKTAISYYENGLRQVSDDKRQAIADALGVSDHALKDHQLHDSADILFTLFEMEDKGYLKPVVTEDSVGVQIVNPLLHDAVLAWNEKHQHKLDGTLSQEDYDEWKDTFELEQTIPPEQITFQTVPFGSHSEDIRSLQMLRQTMEYDISQVQHYIDTDDVLGISQTFETLQRNLLNWLDKDIQGMMEKNKSNQ